MTVAPPGGRDYQGIWAVRAARLYDGTVLHRDRPCVLIEGERVAAVLTAPADPGPGIPVLDLGQVTLLPGLIDSHVHLAFAAEERDKRALFDRDEDELLSVMRRHARQQLLAGVTTVRDLGDRDYLALRLRDEAHGAEPMPHILASGPPITRTRGHCWFLGGEADGAEGVVAAVAARVARGVDVVKIMATGGAITPGWGPHESQYTVDELAGAVRTAHGLGVSITAHAHGPAGIADAVRAGADAVEHASFFTAESVEMDDRTVEAMAAAGTVVGATEAAVPGAPRIAPHLTGRLCTRTTNVLRMHRAGVRVVCCSDAGAGPSKPHGVLVHGVVRLGSFGMTNAAAIASVTTVAAEACGLARRKGRIAPGWDADLIAVAGNPLERLEALFSVRAVIRAGRPVPGL